MKHTDREREGEIESLLIYALRVASFPRSPFKFPLPAANFAHSPHPSLPWPGGAVDKPGQGGTLQTNPKIKMKKYRER